MPSLIFGVLLLNLLGECPHNLPQTLLFDRINISMMLCQPTMFTSQKWDPTAIGCTCQLENVLESVRAPV